MNKKIVVGVTGANGFIGSKIISRLRKEGFKVISLQRTSQISGENAVRVFDLNLLETINEDLLQDLNIIIHTAALVHEPKADNEKYKIMNFEATKKLYEFSKVLKIKKFIFLSTVGVYGKSSFTFPIDINFPVSPESEYGASKLASENYLLKESEEDGSPKISIL